MISPIRSAARALAAAAALVLAPSLVRAQEGAPAPVAITHATVIDVERGRPVRDQTVVVSGGRITAVGPAGRVAVPAGARVVDGRGKYVIPGLWDMHVHAAMPGIAQHFLPLLAANGVTGVREMFSTLPTMKAVRAQVDSGKILGPRMVGSGHILDGRPPVWFGSAVATTADEGRRAVDSLAAGGAEFIKVYSRLPRDAYFAIAEAAKARGIPFAGHVPSLVGVDEASAAGQKSIEHMTGVLSACSPRDAEMRDTVARRVAAGGWTAVTGGTARTRALMESYDEGRCRALARTLARNGTWLVPTMVTLRNTSFLDDTTLAADPRMRFVSKGFGQSWNPRNDFRFRTLTAEDWAVRHASHAHLVRIIRLMREEGVPFLAGTDLSNPYVYPGFSLHDELAELVGVGFTPAQALRAATSDAVRYLGLADSAGTVAAGKHADLVVLDADPLADIRAVGRIHAVVLRGRLIDAAERARLLAEGEARAAR
ncbi:MAG TPA: amidohydrolase family protein [Longimicrobium sp.]|nr:amidohydrolase family protein [Longimicrobium sp.]